MIKYNNCVACVTGNLERSDDKETLCSVHRCEYWWNDVLGGGYTKEEVDKLTLEYIEEMRQEHGE